MSDIVERLRIIRTASSRVAECLGAADEIERLRWWDEQRWSLAADRWQGAFVAAWCAARPEVDYMQRHIQWTDRPDWWPERSRT